MCKSLWCPLQHRLMSHCNKLAWSHDLECPLSAKFEDVHLVVLYLCVFRLLTHRTQMRCCLTLQFISNSIYSSSLIHEETPLNTNIRSLLVSSVEQQWDDICTGLLMFLFPWYRKTAVAFTINIHLNTAYIQFYKKGRWVNIATQLQQSSKERENFFWQFINHWCKHWNMLCTTLTTRWCAQ